MRNDRTISKLLLLARGLQRKMVTGPRAVRSCGMSMVEATVAMALLSTAAIGVARFRETTNDGLRHRELSVRIGWELAAARERIGSWQLTDVTEEKIESLPFSEAIVRQLREPHWRVLITRIEDPVPATQVRLELHCILDEQPAIPDVLTFWLDDDREPSRAEP